MDELSRVAENLHRPIEHTVYPRADVVSEVLLDRLHLVAEGCENQTSVRRQVELLQRVLSSIEARWVAALALEPFAKRHPREIPLQVIRPLMIDALKRRPIASDLAADQGPAMRTPVHHRVKLAFAVPTHDHWRVGDEGGLEVAGVRQFRVQRHIVPGSTAEQPFLFALVNGRVREDPIGDASDALGLWPANGRRFGHGLLHFDGPLEEVFLSLSRSIPVEPGRETRSKHSSHRLTRAQDLLA